MIQSEVQKYLNAEVEDLSQPEKAVDVPAGLRRIELTVKKIGEKAPDLDPFNLASAKIPLSSACTSACFSSVSSVLTSHTPGSQGGDGSMSVESLVRLHDKALDALGQEALVDAAIAKVVELESRR